MPPRWSDHAAKRLARADTQQKQWWDEQGHAMLKRDTRIGPSHRPLGE
jgi:hypothetical protein